MNHATPQTVLDPRIVRQLEEVVSVLNGVTFAFGVRSSDGLYHAPEWSDVVSSGSWGSVGDVELDPTELVASEFCADCDWSELVILANGHVLSAPYLVSRAKRVMSWDTNASPSIKQTGEALNSSTELSWLGEPFNSQHAARLNRVRLLKDELVADAKKVAATAKLRPLLKEYRLLSKHIKISKVHIENIKREVREDPTLDQEVLVRMMTERGTWDDYLLEQLALSETVYLMTRGVLAYVELQAEKDDPDRQVLEVMEIDDLSPDTVREIAALHQDGAGAYPTLVSALNGVKAL